MHIFLSPFLIKQKLNVRDKVRDSDWISALRSCSQAPVTIIILKLIIQLYIHIKKNFTGRLHKLCIYIISSLSSAKLATVCTPLNGKTGVKTNKKKSYNRLKVENVFKFLFKNVKEMKRGNNLLKKTKQSLALTNTTKQKYRGKIP